MLNLPFIKVRAVSGLTLLAALKNSLSTALASVTCHGESLLYEKQSGFF
jgi:predicted benzoate:H+ symporter BenE